MKKLVFNAILTLVAGSVFSATIHVPSEQPTIQAGIDAASYGDTVLVAPGDYQEHIEFGYASVTLLSEAGDSVTFISGVQNFTPIISFRHAYSCTVCGFTIRNAAGATAISTGQNESPTILDCTIRDNVAIAGAGLLCGLGSVLVRRCRFINNVVSIDAAAIWLRSTDSVTIDSCFFSGNSAGISAGAIRVQYSDNVLISCNVGYNNSAGRVGGGFLFSYENETVTVLDNTIFANHSSRGAGITSWNDANIDIRNNIVAFCDGWGIYSNTSVTTEYNDVYSNSAGDYYPGVTPGVGSISEDPLFVDTSTGDYRLLRGSPCISAGDPDPQYNDPNGTRSDIGALGPICSEFEDIDGDGFVECYDNCPSDYNPDQEDADADGTGDACCCILSGDLDQTGGVNVADLTFLVDYMFNGGPGSGCPAHGDVDGVDGTDEADLIYLVYYLFGGGPAPMPCG